MLSSLGHSSSSLSWIHALVLIPLHTNDMHLVLTSMKFLFQLWEINSKDVLITELIQCVNKLMCRKDLVQVYNMLRIYYR